LISIYKAKVVDNIEADDALGLKQDSDTMICSIDKDLLMCEGNHYNFVKKEKYYVTADEGLLNFYMQFLVGDRIDNIIGVRGIGPVKARKLLEDKTAQEMFDVCVEELGSEERAIENGILLYLQRKPDEIWSPPSENAVS